MEIQPAHNMFTYLLISIYCNETVHSYLSNAQHNTG
jgi:hypothetical protein